MLFNQVQILLQYLQKSHLVDKPETEIWFWRLDLFDPPFFPLLNLKG